MANQRNPNSPAWPQVLVCLFVLSWHGKSTTPCFHLKLSIRLLSFRISRWPPLSNAHGSVRILEGLVVAKEAEDRDPSERAVLGRVSPNVQNPDFACVAAQYLLGHVKADRTLILTHCYLQKDWFLRVDYCLSVIPYRVFPAFT